MTDKKRRKFAHEILGLIGISALVSLVIFLVLTYVAAVTVEEYCFQNDVLMTEFDWMEVEQWIFGVGTVISVGCFSVLFLALLRDRLAYIRELTAGIDALRLGQQQTLPLQGNNELTELADAINYLSRTQGQLREKESALAEEKEQFVRTLSHDIRTPLTSILAYSDFLEGQAEISAEEQQAYLQLVRKKAEQIRDLTDILLDGGKREAEFFADARLLMQQLAQEFEEELEEDFSVSTDFSGCPAFSGTFDVRQLRRIFDNLCSNIQKYADPAQPVSLAFRMAQGQLVICQRNAVRRDRPAQEGHLLGLRSIRRIAQGYGGRVMVEQTDTNFEITIEFSAFL